MDLIFSFHLKIFERSLQHKILVGDVEWFMKILKIETHVKHDFAWKYFSVIRISSSHFLSIYNFMFVVFDLIFPKNSNFNITTDERKHLKSDSTVIRVFGSSSFIFKLLFLVHIYNQLCCRRVDKPKLIVVVSRNAKKKILANARIIPDGFQFLHRFNKFSLVSIFNWNS